MTRWRKSCEARRAHEKTPRKSFAVLQANERLTAQAGLGRARSARRRSLNIELRMLVCSVVLGFVHIVAASHAASLQRGYRWTASARDQGVAPLTGVAGRLDRAL